MFWKREKPLAPTGIRTPDLSARSLVTIPGSVRIGTRSKRTCQILVQPFDFRFGFSAKTRHRKTLYKYVLYGVTSNTELMCGLMLSRWLMWSLLSTGTMWSYVAWQVYQHLAVTCYQQLITWCTMFVVKYSKIHCYYLFLLLCHCKFIFDFVLLFYLLQCSFTFFVLYVDFSSVLLPFYCT